MEEKERMKERENERKKERQRNKEQSNEQKTVTNKVDMNPIISIITLNINCLNRSIKSQRLPDWTKKQNATICYLQETNFKYKD